MASVVNSFAISGIDGYVVRIETDTIYGQPSVNIVGLGDTSVKESRERLEAAIVHAKYEFPKMKIVINLAPGDIKKKGSHFDLGMAIGLLIKSNQIIVDEINTFGFIGELSLNAELRPCSGVLPMVIAAKNNGIKNIVAAACGGHNIIMTGAPGCGKSMIAKRIPSILPTMTEEESLEVTKIYSVAGLLKNKGSLITERPFRAPHHNASMNSLIGGGNNAMPGEISLAHNGVLFLDEIAEFNKRTLDALRQPMEDGIVTVSRVKYTNTYPANFMMIAAMNPCPCGHYGNEKCRCTDYEVLKYRQKISGPILDRIDIQKYVQQVDFMDISDYSKGTSSKELRERVERARNIQRKRFKNIENINSNAEMTPSHIRQFCHLENNSKKLLQMAFDRFQYSARTFHKFLKVARTFADMDEAEQIRKQDIAKALMCRDLDKEQSQMIAVS